MSVACHPELPAVVAAGTFNGEVYVWDTSIDDERPMQIAATRIDDYFHREADLESRYKTLVSSNVELIEGQRENERKNEEQRTKFSEYTKTETNKMLNSNNLIANLQQTLETEEAQAGQAQDDFDESIRKAGSETLEVGQVVMAVQNLLQRCTKNHGAIKHYDDSKNNSGGSMHHQENQSVADELKAKGEQTKVDLEVIAAYITDFAAIVSDFEKKVKKVGEKAKTLTEVNPDDTN